MIYITGDSSGEVFCVADAVERFQMQIIFDSYKEGIPDEKTVLCPIW